LATQVWANLNGQKIKLMRKIKQISRAHFRFGVKNFWRIINFGVNMRFLA